MPQEMDPRVIRTRQLIIDAFNTLIATKDFNQITIKEITERATINRATFYAHFLDKYELLDIVLSEQIQALMAENFSDYKTLDEATITHIFEAIIQVHETLHMHCRRGYNTFTQMIEHKAKEQLKLILLPLVANELQATLMSWALYGAYDEWDKKRDVEVVGYAKKIAVSLLKMV
ncbi:MAG: TetR family transcriptional regulator [Solibacillus sp.]